MDGRWPRIDWNPDRARELFASHGLYEEEVEKRCRLLRGRFAALREHGMSPQFWELWRMADLLGIPLEELAEEAFDFTEQG